VSSTLFEGSEREEAAKLGGFDSGSSFSIPKNEETRGRTCYLLGKLQDTSRNCRDFLGLFRFLYYGGSAGLVVDSDGKAFVERRLVAGTIASQGFLSPIVWNPWDKFEPGSGRG